MDYTLLTLDIDPRGVAFVTLNRPDVHNAFNDALIAELTRVFQFLDGNPFVRLAVLSGNGKSFCAGGDVNWMRSMKDYTEEENLADGQKLAQMFATLHAFSKPLIGMVHGIAYGGGCGLTSVCDYVVAADNAKFGFTETRIGLVPATIAPFAMEKIGVSGALAYFISGTPFTAQQARDIGLVHLLVPEAQLADTTQAVIGEFLKAGPQAARQAKALVRNVTQFARASQALTDYTVGTIAHIRTTPEAQEGMSALLEKRQPNWIRPQWSAG